MKTTQSVLLELGDLCAPVGSRSWCIAGRDEAYRLLLSEKSTREQVRVQVAALKRENHFQVLTDYEGHRFMTWEAFCSSPPPFGFDMTAEELEALIESKPLAQQMAADPEVKPLADGPGNPTGKNRNGSATTIRGGIPNTESVD